MSKSSLWKSMARPELTATLSFCFFPFFFFLLDSTDVSVNLGLNLRVITGGLLARRSTGGLLSRRSPCGYSGGGVEETSVASEPV